MVGIRSASLIGLVALAPLALAQASQTVTVQTPEIRVTVDTTGGNPTPEQIQTLKDVSQKAEQTAVAWWPKIVDLIGAQNHPVPKRVTISFNYTYQGVAATGGDHTDVSIPYTLRRPDDIPGVIVHELTHVVQHYTKDTGYDTGWLTEGIADYVRWFHYEPESKRPHPRASRHPHATDAYQTTAAFLYWAVNKYDKNLVKELNEALYDGTYTGDIWKQHTGHTLKELETEWLATLDS